MGYHTFYRDGNGVEKGSIIQFLIGDHIKKSKRIVDIGCGRGEIKNFLEKTNRKKILGLDPDRENVSKKNNVIYGDCEKLPFDDYFDMVIMNGVYFYIKNGARALSEIERVLKKGGVLYITSPVKFVFMEPNYKLPFLSWLPKKLAAKYLQLAGKNDKHYTINLEKYSSLHKKLSKHFIVEDATLKLLNYPDFPKIPKFFQKIIIFMYPLLRNFNANAKFICKKSI